MREPKRTYRNTPAPRDYDTFGDNLKRLRQHINMSQLDLEEASGITRTNISSLETHKTYPSLYTALQIADALEVPITSLTELQEDR